MSETNSFTDSRDIANGKQALDRQDYATAHSLLQPIARKGNELAKRYLGQIPANYWSSGLNKPTSEVDSSDRLGTARWASDEEIASKFLFDDWYFRINDDGLVDGRSNGQIWLGETIDTGDAIGYKDDRHVCLVSGTRGGKGTGIIIPNLCLWPGSAVIVDPKGENASITACRRGEGSDYSLPLGQKVRILDPFNEVKLDPSLKARFNPLSAIDPSSDFAVDDAGRIAAAIVVASEKVADPYWYESARSLIQVLILHVLTDTAFDGKRNLISVWKLINQGDWEAVATLRDSGMTDIPSGYKLLWHGMKSNPSFNGMISGKAQQMLDMAEKTRSGVLSTAIAQMAFLDGTPMQRVLEDSDFDLHELKSSAQGLTVYLTLPQRYMPTHFRWLRLMVNLAVGEMESRKGNPATGFPTLFLLDEFAGLKRMEEIEHAAAQAAGFGVKFFFIVQNLAQLKREYDEAWETFLGNAGAKIFFHLEDDFTKSYLSKQLGEREVIRQTRTGNASRAHGGSYTEGSGSSFGTTDSFTNGRSASTSQSLNSGYSGNDSGDYESFLFFRWKGSKANWSKGKNYSRGESTTTSNSFSHSGGTSNSTNTSRSTSESYTETQGEGWSETIHKRPSSPPMKSGAILHASTIVIILAIRD